MKFSYGTTALSLILTLDDSCLKHGYHWRKTFFDSRNVDWDNDEPNNQTLTKYLK